MDPTLNLTKEQLAVLATLANAFMQAKQAGDGGMQTKTPAAFTTATRLHGAGGIFSISGTERDVISAHVRPEGLASRLPILPSVSVNPMFASLTGVTDDVGDEPTNACDDAPTGYVKGCYLTARFGRVRRDTNTIDMNDVMLKLNRGDFTDLVLHGQMLGLTDLVPSGITQDDVLNIMTAAEMLGVGVRTERLLTRQTWQGTWGVNNEFPGLDSQIATGQVDANTGQACPALDSDVKNYNYAALTTSIVTYVSQLEWFLRHNARKMGLEPVQYVITMRADLWFELTAIWPCAYNTNRCSPAADTGATVVIDGRENVSERDAMRNGMYIDINGRRYPVVIDDGIFEHNSTNNANLIPGEYASSIYMVPLSIVGGLPVTYREYVDYRRAQPDVAFLRNMGTFFWTDNGVYTWAVETSKWCYKLALKTEQRIVLRTPQLAGRIDAIKYSPLQHLRDADPDSPYWVDGGVSVLPGLSAPNAIWA